MAYPGIVVCWGGEGARARESGRAREFVWVCVCVCVVSERMSEWEREEERGGETLPPPEINVYMLCNAILAELSNLTYKS